MSAPRGKNPSCFQCTKRRITCDGDHPTCQKCLKKGIECSGLGRFRFTDGVASRGRLKGCSIPAVGVSPESAFGQRPVGESSIIPPQLRWREGRVQRRKRGSLKEDSSAVQDEGTEDLMIDEPSEGGNHDSEDSTEVEEAERAGKDVLSVAPWLDPLNSQTRMLFSHFAHGVAPVMVIFDSVANGYRDFLLPMACSDDLLRQAVEVVATQYLSQLQPSFQSAAEKGRAAIISRLRWESTHLLPDNVFNISTWATLIVLLVGETVTGSNEYHHLLQTLLCLMKNINRQASIKTDQFLMAQTHMFELLGQPLLGEYQGTSILRMLPTDAYLDWLSYDISAEPEHQRIIHLTRQAFTIASQIYIGRATTNRDQWALAERIRKLVCQIDPDGPGSHALVWVYFIAAADSTDEDHRRFFVDRMDHVFWKTRFSNITSALQSLPVIWSQQGSRRWTENILNSASALIM